MTYNELRKALRAAGCILERQGARHDIWVSTATGAKAAIPGHGTHEVPPGTSAAIRKRLMKD